jgi:hypothetical protein
MRHVVEAENKPEIGLEKLNMKLNKMEQTKAVTKQVAGSEWNLANRFKHQQASENAFRNNVLQTEAAGGGVKLKQQRVAILCKTAHKKVFRLG